MPSQEVTKNAQKGPAYTRVATLISSFPSTNLSKVGLDRALGGYSQTSSSLTGVAAAASLWLDGDVIEQKVGLGGIMNVGHLFNTAGSNVEGGASIYQTSFKISKKNAAPDLVMATQVDVSPQEVPNQIKKWLMAGNVPASNADFQFGLVNATTFACISGTQVWSSLDRTTGNFQSVYVDPIGGGAKNDPNKSKH
jgi:hypothetical protein